MRRQRLLVTLAIALAMVFMAAPAVMAEDLQPANVVLNGKPLADAAGNVVPGYIVQGRTMVPFRAVFQAFGADVIFTSLDQPITAVRGTERLSFTIGSSAATLNGQPYTMPVPPMVINERAMVPLRVTQVFGADFAFDEATSTVSVTQAPKLTSGIIHEGKVGAGGETWRAVQSPHIVRGDFRVEGLDSPVLTIEAGATVRFEKDARITVGETAPGGLMVQGTASKKALLTADSTSPQPGFWKGIRFYEQTLVDKAIIEGATIEYAGGKGDWEGALYLEGQDGAVAVALKDVEFKNSLGTAILLWGDSKLADGSMGLKITGTTGFPIVTAPAGSHNLPKGEYKGNTLNAVRLWNNGSNFEVATNTTWRNMGIPYAVDEYVIVGGDASPTLTIEPGVITLWANDTGLRIGEEKPGTLVADAGARPEGGGEWKAALDLGLQVATAKSLEPGCALCAKNTAIVFGSWSTSPGRGSWEGIRFMDKAGDKNKLNGTVIAYGGRNDDWYGGVYGQSYEQTIKFQLSNSMITGSDGNGLQLYENVELIPGSTGNYFVNNARPIRLAGRHVPFIEAGNTFVGNDNQWVNVWNNGGESEIAKTSTWRNVGIPYFVESNILISGSARPVVTIEPGTTLLFTTGTGIDVGGEQQGSLVAVGAPGKPIKFTSDLERAGSWEGLEFAEMAGKGNRLEHVTIEYATYAVTLYPDLGGFIKNATIRNSSECGIWRNFYEKGTSFLTGLSNQFEGNAEDENTEY